MHPRIDTTRISPGAYKVTRGLQSYVDTTGLETYQYPGLADQCLHFLFEHASARHCHVNPVWRPDWRPTRLTV